MIVPDELEMCYNEGYLVGYGLEVDEEIEPPYTGMEGEWWGDGFEDGNEDSK